MKKLLLLSSLLTLALNQFAFAHNMDASSPMMNPACKPVMERMKSSHEQIEKLIAANKPTDIGNIIISDHKFLEQYPQCKPAWKKHKPM